MSSKNDELIRKHYAEEAIKNGASSSSTIQDEVIRCKEVDLIQDFLTVLTHKSKTSKLKILDLGCGNGYTLSILSKILLENSYYGLDYSDELLNIANQRELPNCKFQQGDARCISFEDNFFDAIYTERCLINLLEWEEQKKALLEIHRVLRPQGYYLMIECFTDGLENNNKARVECGLKPIKEAYHNKYFDKQPFFEFIEKYFSIVNPTEFCPERESAFCANFLSSHYFVARVLHALVTKGEFVRNSEFVKFFSFLPPVGNYSPIQAYILKKRE